MLGYCGTMTIMMILDIFCTGNQVYVPEHFERLLNDLQKRRPNEPIQEKHKLETALYGRHLAYTVIVRCIKYHKSMGTKPLWWSEFESELGKWDTFKNENIKTVQIKRI